MKQKIQVANIALINANNEVLLLKRSKNMKRAGFWGFPGGLIDKGEDAETAAIRELLEETSINTTQYILQTNEMFHIEGKEHYLEVVVFCATLISLKNITLDPYEHTAFKWVEVEKISEALDIMPDIPDMLSRLFRK